MEILKLLKINHYLKNIIVFVPLVFSMNLFNKELFPFSCLMFVSFCLISSSIYVLNDLIDIKSDKLHPIKSKRPVASGKVSVKFAIMLFIFLFLTGGFIAFKINLLCFCMVLSYVILNILYSLELKNLPIIDASCIAFGFILRVLSGCFAISVLPSPLVILMTFFASMFFTFTKRKLELKLVDDVSQRRKSLSGFSTGAIDQFVLINAILSISFYMTYVLDKTTILRAGSEYLYITSIPFALIIYRILFLIKEAEIDDPIIFIEKDKTVKMLILIYLFTLFVTIFSSKVF